MKKILSILLFSITFLIAGSPGAWYLEDLSSVNISEVKQDAQYLNYNYDAKINEQNSTEYEALLKSEKLLEQQNTTEYFHPYFQYQSAKLTCPPLLEKYKNSHFGMIDKLDYASGKVTCSVYWKPFLNAMKYNEKATTAFPILEKVYSQTFQNPIYIEELKSAQEHIPQNLINEEALQLANLYSQKLKYSRDVIKFKFSGGFDEYSSLNLSQVLDAVMVFDDNIIDMQLSFDTQSLQFKDGLTAAYFDENLIQEQRNNKELIKNISEKLNSKISFMPKLFQPNSQSSIDDTKSTIAILLSSKLNMVIYFIIKYWTYFEEVFYLLLVGALAYGTFNLSQYYLQNMGSNDKYLKYKTIFAGALIFSIFSMFGPFDTLKINDEDKQKEIGISTIQSGIIALSQYTSSLNDEISAAIIDSYTSTMFDDVGLSASQINATAKLHQKSKFVQAQAAEYYSQCENIYDTESIALHNKDWFAKQSKQSINSFVPTGMMKKISGGYSPYNKSELSGYVKNANLFAELGYSMDSCYYMQKDLFSNLRKLNFIQKRIDVFNDIDSKEAIFLQKEATLSNLWSEFYQFGYLATPMIATTETLKKIQELPAKKAEEWLTLISDFNTDSIIKFGLENSILVLTIGDAVQSFSTKVAKLATDGLIGWVPFVGSTFSNVSANTVGFITAFMYVDIIIELIPNLRGLFMYMIATIYLFLTFIMKFVVFWLIPFAVLRIFGNLQGDKIFKDLIKVAMVFLKPTIFLFVFFLSLFIMDFFANFVSLFIDRMVIGLGGDTTNYAIGYFIKGFAELLSLILQFIVVYQLLTKGTKSIIEWFEISANDLTETLTDGVSSTIQQKVIK